MWESFKSVCVCVCVCAHVLRGALFVQLILLWSSWRSGTRGPTVVPASCSSLLPYTLPSKPHQFPLHLPKYCSLSSEISLLLRLSSSRCRLEPQKEVVLKETGLCCYILAVFDTQGVPLPLCQTYTKGK